MSSKRPRTVKPEFINEPGRIQVASKKLRDAVGQSGKQFPSARRTLTARRSGTLPLIDQRQLWQIPGYDESTYTCGQKGHRPAESVPNERSEPGLYRCSSYTQVAPAIGAQRANECRLDVEPIPRHRTRGVAVADCRGRALAHGPSDSEEGAIRLPPQRRDRRTAKPVDKGEGDGSLPPRYSTPGRRHRVL